MCLANAILRCSPTLVQQWAVKMHRSNSHAARVDAAARRFLAACTHELEVDAMLASKNAYELARARDSIRELSRDLHELREENTKLRQHRKLVDLLGEHATVEGVQRLLDLDAADGKRRCLRSGTRQGPKGQEVACVSIGRSGPTRPGPLDFRAGNAQCDRPLGA